MPDSTWIDNGTQIETKTSDKIILWIKNNRQTSLGILVILGIILVFSISFYINYSKNTENVQRQLFLAQQVAFGGRTDVGIKQLTEIENNYPNRPEADFAIFTKGDLYFSNEKYKEAISEYEKIINKPRNQDLIPYALYSISKSYQAMADYNKAISMAKDFLSKYPEHFLSAQVYMSLAHCYEKTGDISSANETYEKITVLYPDTLWADEAKTKIKTKK
jgi:tetratricopeptide (TPR) repeat protein